MVEALPGEESQRIDEVTAGLKLLGLSDKVVAGYGEFLSIPKAALESDCTSPSLAEVTFILRSSST